MHLVSKNIEKNRLTVTLVGFISEIEAKAIKKSIIKETAYLSENFDVITDISHFRLLLEQSAVVFKEIMNFLQSKKVNRIVRVVGSSKGGMIQLASFTVNEYKTHVSYVPALEDAILLLDDTQGPAAEKS